MENKQLIKGSLNTIILKLLNDHDSMYGYEITQFIKEMTKGEMMITEGALYPALHRLEADDLICSEVKNANGRKRKYYRLTESGEKSAAIKLEEVTAFFKNVQLLLSIKPTQS